MGRRRPQGRFGVVVSLYNTFVTRRLLEGCLSAFRQNGIPRHRIDVVWVPGAFEIPFACQSILHRRRYRALVALGAVIKGETPHFEYVSSAAADGILRVSLDERVPIAFGVVTALNRRQALERSGRKENRGREAAESALQMTELFGGKRR